MGVCMFDPKKIAELARHAVASKEWSMGYETDRKPAPGLLFVHDQGVYCISNGIPIQPAEGRDGCHAVYARGCDPHAGSSFDEWYGMSRDLVGGDDFAEVISVDDQFIEDCSTCDKFCIEVTAESLSAYFTTRRSKCH